MQEIKCAYIFDVDNTLADCSHRLHFILPKGKNIADLEAYKPDWDAFYSACLDDKAIMDVVSIWRRLAADPNVEMLFVTGRPEKYKSLTFEWLCKWVSPKLCNLYMRTDGDHRPDWIVKAELYEKYIKGHYYIQGVFEDRLACVNMWRNLGLTCFQVADGNY